MKGKIGIISMLFLTLFAQAKEDVERQSNTGNKNSERSYRNAMKFGSDCDPATALADLDVNNVRTKIMNGGDMWWDLSNPKYEIPKIDDLNSIKKHSMFSGAIWIGGEDITGNLKLAAMTYRQRGSDFWPGPLDTITSNTNSSVCQEYDRIVKVDRANIIAHVEDFERNGSISVLNNQIDLWPGQGNFGFQERPLAPFFDYDGDGRYNPRLGDYPVLQTHCNGEELENAPEDQPDQMLWFVYNDKGNIHSETQGDPIGVELQTTAFAFATNNEINDMTFYTTRIINRGFTQLKNTYFGQWVDPDLGNYSDDYVGCDVPLSLGFCYNGDDNDEGVLGYGLNPPSVGVDFFEGPIVDTIIDGVPTKHELGMSKFVYYNNNTNPINGNPNTAIQFYNYLRGRWMNGNQIEFGGDGITGTDGTPADYMFPFDTDPAHPGQNWNERQSGNIPLDRRFLQSSGPFILEPGAIQRLTVGVVWARASFGGAEGSLELLKIASQTAQELFNSCFNLVDGPDAPEVQVQELDQQLVFTFSNTNSPRVEEYYEEVINGFDELEKYNFQGYRIFQLKNGTVSLSELDNVSRAREVFQCDLKDTFSILINHSYDADVEEFLPRKMVAGTNQGLSHSVSLTQDAFAAGANRSLVNFKTYYYIVLSYAAGESRNREYLEGRLVKRFSASPRKSEPRLGGSNLQSSYGGGPKLMRLAGTGNGANTLDLTPESEEAIVYENFLRNPVYENGRGPVKVSVIDPIKVPKGDFELTMIESPVSQNREGLVDTNTVWILVKLPNDTIFADYKINYRNEQIILEATTGTKIKDWGMAVTISQVSGPGDNEEGTHNGLLDWEVVWEDPANQWLTAIQDLDNSAPNSYGVTDWIRSGLVGSRRDENFNDPSIHDFARAGNSIDPAQDYEQIWGGRVAPFRLVAHDGAASPPGRAEQLVQGMGYNVQANNNLGINNIASINLVITKDKSKWSECVMIEMGEDEGLNEGGVEKYDLRAGQLTWSGGTLKEGKTMFPGYAVNLETGERLNIIISEDSYQISENGRDMKWNPTSRTNQYNTLYPSFGGRQYIYVMGSHEGISSSIHPKLPIYDKGEEYWNRLVSATTPTAKFQAKTAIFQNCMWVVPTYLAPGKEMLDGPDGIPLPPTEFTLKLRVQKPYAYQLETASENGGNPKYSFNTDDIYNEINKRHGENAIELINVVPNPYYAFAGANGYEHNALENKVKFTNLPVKCDISIYTLDGALVRRIRKDDESTDVVWDLKNRAAVPIASGLYIIHVDAHDLGEKVLKWMGIMRELDLDSF